MQISKINAYSFRGEDFVIAYDDSVSRERRQFIRENIEYETMRYQNIYEKEPRLGEYQLKNLIDFFAKKPRKVNGETIFNLPLSNVHNISSTSRYQPNIYRGSTLYEASKYILETVKKAGIKTVIDLAGYGEGYKKEVESAGLKFLDFSIHSLRCSTDEISKKNKLVEFIKTMQEEYVYLGCEFGTYKTDAAVRLNTFFNPKVKGYCKIFSPDMISDISEIADSIYLNMTREDKIVLGWTKEFERDFNSKMKKILHL